MPRRSHILPVACPGGRRPLTVACVGRSLHTERLLSSPQTAECAGGNQSRVRSVTLTDVRRRDFLNYF